MGMERRLGPWVEIWESASAVMVQGLSLRHISECGKPVQQGAQAGRR